MRFYAADKDREKKQKKQTKKSEKYGAEERKKRS